MRVLVVDDERQDLRSVSITLRSRGFKVFEAWSASMALDQMKRGCKIDVVLTDYLMPEMDGMELLKTIRQDFGHVPVIIMTAYADKDLAIDALHHDCNGFLEKPFNSEDLFAVIEQCARKFIQKMNLSWFSHALPKIIHQMNNPLMTITGAADLGLLEPNNTDTVIKSFKEILDATNKLSEINRNLLHGGSLTSNAEAQEGFSIHKVLEDCIESFSGLLGLKNIELKKEFVGNDPRVKGNKFNLEQAFKNLLLNSIDSLENIEHKYITVTTEFRTNGVLSIYISDTGCGIPKKMFEAIFEPYWSTKKKGNGLGLVVVKEIIDNMDGAITLKSKVGQGTVFRIDLPLHRTRQKGGKNGKRSANAPIR